MSGFLSAGIVGGSDIPDSDVWYPVDEGSGSKITDNIGSVNASLNGDPTWVSDSGFVNGFYLDLDGTGDYAVISNRTVIDFSRDFSFAITVKADSQLSDGSTVWSWSDGSKVLGVTIDNGDFIFAGYDGSSFIGGPNDPQPSAPYTVRIWTYWDASTQTFEMYVNGSEITTTQSTVNLSAADEFVVGARSGGANRITAGIDDIPIWDGERSNPQDDYDRQPWS